jgi:transcriptional regulator
LGCSPSLGPANTLTSLAAAAAAAVERRELAAGGPGQSRVALTTAATLPIDVREARFHLPFDARKEGDDVTDRQRDDLLQGTLDMLVLKALQLGPMHGWGITERLERGSGDVLQIGQGSLYPALYRLERQGLVTSEWRLSDNNRRARWYALTAAGRARLVAKQRAWHRVSRAVSLILAMEK